MAVRPRRIYRQQHALSLSRGRRDAVAMTDTTGSLLHLDHELYDRLFEQRTILLGEPWRT